VRDARPHKDCADNHVHNSSSSDNFIHNRSTISPANDNPATSPANDRRSGELFPLDGWR
jgi:hypothetical protein